MDTHDFLQDNFDCVLFFTWSDWDKEPRSNRFHYSKRFANLLPLFFFQHKYKGSRDLLSSRPSAIENLQICDTTITMLQERPDEIYLFIKKLGYKRPLIWVYDHMNYAEVIKSFPNAFKIYHATENYLYDSKSWTINQSIVGNSLIQAINNKYFDQIVACAPSVKASILKNTSFDSNKIIFSPNGCDYKLIKSYLDGDDYSECLESKFEKVVCFQGGINERLDYKLLFETISSLPNYGFKFLGSVSQSDINIKNWRKIASLPNVIYLGELEQHFLFKEISKSDIGIIPYISDEWIKASLPIKSFEYLACGIPVVTVPIDYLSRFPQCFFAANNSSKFIKAIKDQSNKKNSEVFLKLSQEYSRKHDYDFAFEDMLDKSMKNYLLNKSIEPISSVFDCVLFFTWSDWDKEPRSNRYHYATRFAKLLPVFFFQHKYSSNKKYVSLNSSNSHNITICDICINELKENPDNIFSFLKESGYVRPLIWVYDHMNYVKALKYFPSSYIVYHATENYLMDSGGRNCNAEIADTLISVLSEQLFDHIVVCAPSIKDSLLTKSFYKSTDITFAPNGCDFKQISDELFHITKNDEINENITILYQGAINERIDFDLLFIVISNLPKYKFKFFGKVAKEVKNKWDKIIKLNNVDYQGFVNSSELYKEISSADVGIIPFTSDEWIKASLPLKSFEYLSCGLPVVSVPIDYFSRFPDVFRIADTPEKFIKEIQSQVLKRNDKKFLTRARSLSEMHDYDVSFSKILKSLYDNFLKQSKAASTKKILILYDAGSTHVATVREHLHAFEEYSSFNTEFLPASNEYWEKEINQFNNKYPIAFDYEAVVIHFSVRVSIPGFHIYKPLLDAILELKCIKAIFIQDEYEFVECTRRFLDLYKPNIVFTSIPNESVDKIYPKYRYPYTIFKNNLTGYTGDQDRYSKYRLTYQNKKITFAYRGRELPPYYGQLGFDKYNIGIDVADYCRANNIPHDISCKVEDRIYSESWLEFLGSSIATLGTESGSNIFDETGSFKSLFDEAKDLNPDIDNRKFYDKYFSKYEDYVKMNQISPKFFEAISLNTLLVLYKGNYSDVIKPGIHYLELEKDLSNIQEIIEILKDQSKVEKITSQAYKDVIESEKYSYKRFISDFDSLLLQFLAYPTRITERLKLRKSKKFNTISSPVILPNLDFFNNPSIVKEENKYSNVKDFYPNKSIFKNNLYKFLRKFRSVLRNSQPKFLLGRKRNLFYLFLAIPFFVLQIIRKAILIFLLKLKNILLIKVAPIIRKNRIIYLIIRKIYHPIKKIIARFLNY